MRLRELLGLVLLALGLLLAWPFIDRNGEDLL